MRTLKWSEIYKSGVFATFEQLLSKQKIILWEMYDKRNRKTEIKVSSAKSLKGNVFHE